MTAYTAWSIPAEAATTLEQEAFRFLDWRVGGPNVRPATEFPWRRAMPSRWVGEIKPHTRTGIAAGIRQLHAGSDGPHRLLVTYRRKDDQTVEVLASLYPKHDMWYLLGTHAFGWKQLVPLDSCRACLGGKVEGTVRQIVRALDPRITPHRTASAKGRDLSTDSESELLAEVSFLRGSVNELTAR